MKVIGLIALIVGAAYGVPINLADDEPVCGYATCHPVDHDKINIHLVPHSHDDVGWIKTVDQYYYQQVQYIISSVVLALTENPDRRFIQVETAFFYMWWNQQTDAKKAQVRQLIDEGRLEIINGAWSMNDEADVHYQSTIDQYTLGLRFIEDNLGKCARPRVGWQIDPFGHSREQGSILTQMGMDGVFFARVDVRDKNKRLKDKTMDMIWTSSANLGSDSNLFTSVLYHHYSSPPGFCFDVRCDDTPIIIDGEEYNWDKRVDEFAFFIRDMRQHYPTSHLLITLGDDFKWEAALNSYINLDRLIEGFKKFNTTIDGQEVNIIYSTPSCYTKAVRDYVELKNIQLEEKTDDFFPYADNDYSVWAGYFSSRPTSKRLERYANNLHQVTKQITALGGQPYGLNFPLSKAMGIMQHHDAITGTEKTAVEKDYHKTLVNAMYKAIGDISSSFSSILGLENDINLKSCFLSNVSICSESDKNEFTLLLYNPLARKASHYIQIPVNDGTWKVTGPSGEELENVLTEPIRNFDYIVKKTSEKVLKKVLFFRAEDLPALGYKVYKFEKISSESKAATEQRAVQAQVGFADRYVNIDLSTGLLNSITLNGVTLSVTQEMLFYNSSSLSGAYIFRPDDNIRDAVRFGDGLVTVLVNDGNLIREVKQIWEDWAMQVIRIYKEEDFIEFDWSVGPIDVTGTKGVEVITRYTTELTDVNEEFYTDSNGREMIYRKKDFRATYKYTDIEPQAGNYYPVNTKILVKNADTEFAVLTDRSEGGSSLTSGQIELMLNRDLVFDDARGVGENLDEKEYDQGLVARGSHFVTLGKSAHGNGGRTMAAVERDIAQRKLLQPWVFFPSEDVPVKEQSFLNKELPQNVHLLTLESWGESENKFLIRLEHILEKDEDPKLSQEVTVDVSDLFKTLKIKSLKEHLLAANTPLEESSRLKWPQVAKTESESSPLNIKNRLARDETNLKITLSPMQIRTFVATVEPAA